jgi:SAM-dependent methyltransferase
MKSETRKECEAAVIRFSKIINESDGGDLLYVGIAGDPAGGEYAPLFTRFKIKTFDLDSRWGPDLIGDITKTEFSNDSWDVIICVQTMEHIPNIVDLPIELFRILKPKKYAIVDCPWMYHYHPEPPSFGDFWRITQDGFQYLFKQFNILEIISTEHNTSCLLQKP